MRVLQPSVARSLSTIAQRLRDMDAPYPLTARQIGNRPRHAENAGIATCGQPHRFCRLRKQLAAGLVGRGDRLEQIAVDLRIGAYARPRICLLYTSRCV